MKEGIMNVIGKGTFVKGEMKVAGSIRVDGRIEGTIEVSDTIVVGADGSIKGTVRTKSATVSGKVEGEIMALEKVELTSTAKFTGDLTCKKLIVEEGVIMDGTLTMSDGSKPKKTEAKV